MASLLKAQALRLKYLTPTAYTSSIQCKRTAVVIAATSGIGRACANRLAEQGYTVIAIGRDRPGRAASVVQELQSKSRESSANVTSNGDGNGDGDTEDSLPKHEFHPCDAFSLAAVKKLTEQISSKHDSIDVLVLSQGMATTQGHTPTEEGNDEKLTLHYYSRMAMTLGLLPALRKSSNPNGATVLTVLSGGVHGVYEKMEEDVTLEKNYSIKNAADAAGYYNDLGFDYLAQKEENQNIHFVHAAPGFVNTNWGQEFNFILRAFVRCTQVFAKSPGDCADYLLSPTVFATDAGEELPQRLDGRKDGIHILGEHGQVKPVTKKHNDRAKTFLWSHTCDVLEKVGWNLRE